MNSAEASDGQNNNNQRMDLAQSIREARRIFNIYLENKMEEAVDMCNKKGEEDNSYLWVTRVAMNAVISLVGLEEPDIAEGKEICRKASDVVSKHRRALSLNENIASFFWKPNFDDYTDEELHAELITAVISFCQAFLIIFSGQTFASFVKAAWKIRTSYQCFKLCDDAVKSRKCWESEIARDELKCGAALGMGVFNLFAAHLPAKILKLLAFFGYPSDRTLGLKLINEGNAMTECFWRELILLITGFYCYYLVPIFGFGDSGFDDMNDILNRELERRPKSSLYLLCKARSIELEGNPEEALKTFKMSIEAQNEWKALHNVCYWDMIWCHAVLGQWKEAADLAKNLMDQCKWSPATNCYQYGVFTLLDAQSKNEDQSKKVLEIIKSVPNYTTRLAGKRLPPEKFAVSKSIKFYATNGRVAVPALELMHCWSILVICGRKQKYLQPLLDIVNRDLVKFKALNLNDSDVENFALCLLLKGVILKELSRSEEAIECFKQILAMENNIVDDVYLLPNACCEMGLAYIELGEFNEAKKWLEAAQNNYSNYLIETMIHFRAHNGLRTIKDAAKAEKQRKKLSKSR